jgi:hypothetical protein
VETVPFRPQQEPVHATADRIRTGGGFSGHRWQDGAMELPDFHIPHAEKIEWMIETNGWAI